MRCNPFMPIFYSVSRETAPAIAAAGVDLISAGWLTHSAPSLDNGLDAAE